MTTTTSTVRRSISCYSLPLSGEHFADENRDDGSGHGDRLEEKREMAAVLLSRRETLDALLARKLAELKEICLQEAAITGVLPRETPLHPNEPKPVIRRKVRTEFSLSDKLLTSPTTPEEKQLADLELQLEIQKNIAQASKKLMNERSIKQKVKKQRKCNYEEAVAKLHRLESDLALLKKQLLEEQRTQLENKNRIKRQAIEKHLSPQTSAHCNLQSSGHPGLSNLIHTTIMNVTAHPAGSRRLARKRRGKVSSTSSDTDPPATPSNAQIVTREFKVHPLSPVSADDFHIPSSTQVTSSPVAKTTSILKKSRPPPEVVVYDEPDNCVTHNSSHELMRSSSLENVRRKSYISAVCTTDQKPAFRGMTSYDQHIMANKLLPKNPPPPIPSPMAKRPLPPTPSQVLSSISEPSVTDSTAASACRLTPVHDVEPVSQDVPSHRLNEVDISARAVRSSVIRTPAITVSTTSSSDAVSASSNQKTNQRESGTPRPSPAPSPAPTHRPVRSRAYSGPAAPEETRLPLEQLICSSPTIGASSSLRRQLEGERQTVIEESTTMPPPSHLPLRKPKQGREKILPQALPALNPSNSRCATPETRSFTPSIENDVFEADEVPPPSPFISKPRPDPIPMSPQVNSQTGVVVEIGTCRPSYEETKPFEFSDALKYSAKHRRRQETGGIKEAAAKEQFSTNDFLKPVPNILNESFAAPAAVSDDFTNEMVDWYDENVKKGTVV